jgi:histidinol phosphatase-like enzyme
MIGDADRDMAAAFKAGCRAGYRIGEGEGTALTEDRTGLLFVRSFEEAVRIFLDQLDAGTGGIPVP